MPVNIRSVIICVHAHTRVLHNHRRRHAIRVDWPCFSSFTSSGYFRYFWAHFSEQNSIISCNDKSLILIQMQIQLQSTSAWRCEAVTTLTLLASRITAALIHTNIQLPVSQLTAPPSDWRHVSQLTARLSGWHHCLLHSFQCSLNPCAPCTYVCRQQ